MPTRLLRLLPFAAGWVASTLLLYVSLFGGGALRTNLDVQMHNTYFVLSPGLALLGLALLLTPLVGAFYFLLARRPGRAGAWAIGLFALLLLYLLGDTIEALAHLSPVERFRMYQGYAPDQVPAESPLARLLPILRVLQLLMGLLALLAGRALGRYARSQTAAPDAQG